MASGRCVSNDTISRPPRSPLLWAVALRADVLFGVEQPNEQQAGVRNVAPDALPSDYHTKTHLCVCERERETLAHSPVQRGNTARTSLAFFFFFLSFFATRRRARRQSEEKRRVSNEGRGIKAGKRGSMTREGERGAPAEVVKVAGCREEEEGREEEQCGEVKRSHRERKTESRTGVSSDRPANL